MHVFHKTAHTNLTYQISFLKAFKEHDHAYINFELSTGAWNVVPFCLSLPDACVAIWLVLFYFSSPDVCMAIWLLLFVCLFIFA